MRFSVLASGSSGNATLIDTPNTALLIDCGLSVKRLEQRAQAAAFDLQRLSAILVTHEHSDHIGGVARLADRYSIPVYMTHGTRAAVAFGEGRDLDITEISPHESFTIGDIRVRPAPVPHDAREPCQFVLEYLDSRLGVLTDLGSDTQHIEAHFADCCALVLEFNHDLSLLAGCEYPASVKERISGRLGHFNNEQAVELLAKLRSQRLRHVLGAHVSARANDVEVVRAQLHRALADSGVTWDVAAQDSVSDWVSL